MNFQFFGPDPTKINIMQQEDIIKRITHDQLSPNNDDWCYEQITIVSANDGIQQIINQGIFTYERIASKYASQKIHVHKQRLNITDLEVQLKNTQGRMWPIRKYVQRANKFVENKDTIAYFAVNISMIKWDEECLILQNILPTVYCCSRRDGLRYLETEGDGISSPQLYMKVQGVYTGGHQENLRLTSININFGPGSSEWITVEKQYLLKLRQIVLQYTKQKVDIIIEETLWYIDPERLIEWDIPFKRIIQGPGETVLVGPGCIHWVRALGKSVQAAWNYMPIIPLMIEEMISRSKLNIDLKIPMVLPIKNLFHILITQGKQSLNTEMMQMLVGFLREEIHRERLHQLVTCFDKKLNFVLDTQQQSSIYSCYACKQEVFLLSQEIKTKVAKNKLELHRLCFKCLSYDGSKPILLKFDDQTEKLLLNPPNFELMNQ